MKEFNLEEAKAGKPVCTRDGRKVRIVSFDRVSKDNKYPIAALVTVCKNDGHEVVHVEVTYYYTIDGKKHSTIYCNSSDDLIMATVKHEGWISLIYCPGELEKTGVYNPFCYERIFPSKEEALNAVSRRESLEVIKVIKIDWEE